MKYLCFQNELYPTFEEPKIAAVDIWVLIVDFYINSDGLIYKKTSRRIPSLVKLIKQKETIQIKAYSNQGRMSVTNVKNIFFSCSRRLEPRTLAGFNLKTHKLQSLQAETLPQHMYHGRQGDMGWYYYF
jgi:hypothetical protein